MIKGDPQVIIVSPLYLIRTRLKNIFVPNQSLMKRGLISSTREV